MWYKSLATAMLFPASAKQWASPGTNFTSLGRLGARESLTKKIRRGLPAANTDTGPRCIHTAPVPQAASTRPWGWTWGTSGAPSAAHARQDHGCFLHRFQRTGPYWDPGEEVLCAGWQHTVGTVVRAPPCTPSGGKEGAGLTPRRKRV